MTKVPSLGYDRVIRALQRDVWVVVRQKGSHIRLHKKKGGRQRAVHFSQATGV